MKMASNIMDIMKSMNPIKAMALSFLLMKSSVSGNIWRISYKDSAESIETIVWWKMVCLRVENYVESAYPTPRMAINTC